MSVTKIVIDTLMATSLSSGIKDAEDAERISAIMRKIIDEIYAIFPNDKADQASLETALLQKLNTILPQNGYGFDTTIKIGLEARMALKDIYRALANEQDENIPASAKEETEEEHEDNDAEDAKEDDEGNDEDELSEFELQVKEMLDKLSDKYSDAFYFGTLILPHSCIENEMYTDSEALDIIRDFVIETDRCFDPTDYATWIRSVRKCFENVLVKHHYPKTLIPDAKIEMDVKVCLRRIETNLDIFDEEVNSGRYDPDDIKPIDDDDMRTVDLATIFATIPYDPEDEEFCKTIDVEYDYDHHHMATWFSGQITLGEGNYSRRIPNISARTTYNHLTNPYSFLWIATVMGIHHDLIRKAYNEMQSGKTFSAKCAIIRKLIPFDMILCQAQEILDEQEE